MFDPSKNKFQWSVIITLMAEFYENLVRMVLSVDFYRTFKSLKELLIGGKLVENYK
jgi:hypothetical protein